MFTVNIAEHGRNNIGYIIRWIGTCIRQVKKHFDRIAVKYYNMKEIVDTYKVSSQRLQPTYTMTILTEQKNSYCL